MRALQGLCLPFRGLSRSGSPISTGLFLGFERRRVEQFSFAPAVVLTPAVIAKEGYRLLKAQTVLIHASSLFDLAWPSLMAMIFSFVAGLAALRWLSRWLEHGRWHLFGYYCLFAAGVSLRCVVRCGASRSRGESMKTIPVKRRARAPRRLDGVPSALTGSDPDHLFHRKHEDLAVPDATGGGGFADRLHDLFDQVVGDCDFELDLWHEVDDVLSSSIELGVSLLSAEALRL